MRTRAARCIDGRAGAQAADGKKDEKKVEKPVDPVVAAMTGSCFFLDVPCVCMAALHAALCCFERRALPFSRPCLTVRRTQGRDADD